MAQPAQARLSSTPAACWQAGLAVVLQAYAAAERACGAAWNAWQIQRMLMLPSLSNKCGRCSSWVAWAASGSAMHGLTAATSSASSCMPGMELIKLPIWTRVRQPGHRHLTSTIKFVPPHTKRTMLLTAEHDQGDVGLGSVQGLAALTLSEAPGISCTDSRVPG